MKRSRANRGSANVGCIVWLVEQAAFGSIKDVKFIEFEILRKAEELKIPVKKDNLKVTRSREMITVEAHYTITIDFFNGAYKYDWKFDPVVQRPLFAV